MRMSPCQTIVAPGEIGGRGEPCRQAIVEQGHRGVKGKADPADNSTEPGRAVGGTECSRANTYSTPRRFLQMKSSIRFACLAAILVGLIQLPVGVATPQVAEEGSDLPPPPPPLPVITYFDGTDWKQLGRHSISVEGAGATPAGTATATFKAKLDGPKTYVVIDGATSEALLSVPRPRFRIESDRTG